MGHGTAMGQFLGACTVVVFYAALFVSWAVTGVAIGLYVGTEELKRGDYGPGLPWPWLAATVFGCAAMWLMMRGMSKQGAVRGWAMGVAAVNIPRVWGKVLDGQLHTIKDDVGLPIHLAALSLLLLTAWLAAGRQPADRTGQDAR